MTTEFQNTDKEWKTMVQYVRTHEQELQQYGNNYILITPQGEVLDTDPDKFRLARRNLPQRGFVIRGNKRVAELPSPEVDR